MQTTIAYYCPNCEQWSKEEICSKCGSKLEKKELPIRRDEYYFINGFKEPLPSVNSVIDILSKPWLIQWAAKEGAKALIKNPFLGIQDAIKAVNDIKIKAGEIGSTVHKIIEDPTSISKNAIPKEIKPYIEAYNKFNSDFVVRTILKEEMVFSRKYKFAGTLDRLVEMKNKEIALIDFKTNHTILQRNLSLQLSAYKQAVLESNPSIKVSRLIGVHLKNDGSYSLIEVPDSFKIFKALLLIHQWLKNSRYD